MFLSRLALDPRDQSVRRDLSNCHEIHRTLLKAFGQVTGGSARAALGVLFRVEEEVRQVLVYVQSKAPPDWTRLPPGYLRRGFSFPEGNPAVRSLDVAYDSIQEGRALRFRLLANPTCRVGGNRVPLVSTESLMEWIHRKGKQGGFELLLDPSGCERVEIIQGADLLGVKGPHQITVRGVRYEGALRVTDRDQFRATLEKGIGPGKAYGFGLLSITPRLGAH